MTWTMDRRRTWLTKAHVSRRVLWVFPAVAGSAAIGYLAWGAWRSAHDPHWLYLSNAWWRTWLRPANDLTLVAAGGLWLVILLCYWWPRRLQPRTVGLTTVVAMVVIGTVLASVSLVPCRGVQTKFAVADWVLGLFLGNPPSAYQTNTCPGQMPLALQFGETICLLATLVGAIAAAAVIWRQPWGRLRGRFVRDVTVFTGLDAMTTPLLRQLARQERPSRIVVVEPDGDHPGLDEVRATGARVMVGDPTSVRVLLPVLVGWRGCTLKSLYALHRDVAENEAILTAARKVLGRYPPSPQRQPHLVARIDDARHADHWRGRHSGTSSLWFEDAVSSQETTAYAVANEVFKTGAHQLLLCGDSTLTLAILLELAHRAWERRELEEAAAAGASVWPTAVAGSVGDHMSAPLAVERVLLLDQRAADLRREYLATAPPNMAKAMPVGVEQTVGWKGELLAVLDRMEPATAESTVVVIAETISEDGVHKAGRAARLHPSVPVFVLTSEGEGVCGAIFDRLQPFQRVLLVNGRVPDDTWTRLARHWHECFRLRHPPEPGHPVPSTRHPWSDLDQFFREDNILQLRSILTEVAACGRRWVPARAVQRGSFIELSERDLETIARAEHARWYQSRLAAGRSAGSRGRPDDALTGSRVMPWADLRPEGRARAIRDVRSQVEQLEDMGFMPVVPAGGPAGAIEFQRVGTVRARLLHTRRTWHRRSGSELSGDAGDWRVLDDFGDERTVRDAEFRASHEPLNGDIWRRTGTFRAWRVSDEVVLRTLEGRAVAKAGDWIVEGPGGERWPVTDRQFRRTYRLT
jgi:hypothetical protein